MSPTIIKTYINSAKMFEQIKSVIYDLNNYKYLDYYIDISFEGQNIVFEIKSNTNNNILPSSSLIVNVAGIISELIIKFYENKLIRRLINNNYCYFTTYERTKIFELTKNFTVIDESKDILTTLFFIRRKSMIVTQLLEYLKTNTEFILEGFINFRLEEYLNQLDEIIEKAVDQFLVEREYKEFIKLLRYFVEIQEPKYKYVHIILNNDKYTILDDTKTEITDKCIRDFIKEMPDTNLNYDDLLVSSLITLAPQKVYMHFSDDSNNKKILETIKSIFINKVSVCSGCKLCKTNALIVEKIK